MASIHLNDGGIEAFWGTFQLRGSDLIKKYAINCLTQFFARCLADWLAGWRWYGKPSVLLLIYSCFVSLSPPQHQFRPWVSNRKSQSSARKCQHVRCAFQMQRLCVRAGERERESVGRAMTRLTNPIIDKCFTRRLKADISNCIFVFSGPGSVHIRFFSFWSMRKAIRKFHGKVKMKREILYTNSIVGNQSENT